MGIEFEQVVAIKQLNPDGHQGNQEFIVEVCMLSVFHHPNLVTLIGYCTSGAQRLLVYEYMPMGSLEDHLFGKCVFPNHPKIKEFVLINRSHSCCCLKQILSLIRLH